MKKTNAEDTINQTVSALSSVGAAGAGAGVVASWPFNREGITIAMINRTRYLNLLIFNIKVPPIAFRNTLPLKFLKEFLESVNHTS